LDELSKARSASRYLAFLGELAVALGRAGQIADGLAAIEEAIEQSERTEECWATAELLRVKGFSCWKERPGPPAAEDHFRQARTSVIGVRSIYRRVRHRRSRSGKGVARPSAIGCEEPLSDVF
jgi:hypothetical protein